MDNGVDSRTPPPPVRHLASSPTRGRIFWCHSFSIARFAFSFRRDVACSKPQGLSMVGEQLRFDMLKPCGLEHATRNKYLKLALAGTSRNKNGFYLLPRMTRE